GRHVLRRVDRESRRGPARRRRLETLRSGARSHRRHRGEGAEGRWTMMVTFDLAGKTSLIAGAGLLVAAILRVRSAARRRWILAMSVACIAALPLLTIIVPTWQLPIAGLAPASVTPPASSAVSVTIMPQAAEDSKAPAVRQAT